ncbi:MAG: hypothetical protein ACI9JM_000470 [Halioglobus sp.]|jgi:uncharacterized protein YbjT (DUF2867 family)
MIPPGRQPRSALLGALVFILLSACTAQQYPDDSSTRPAQQVASQKEITIALLGATGMVGEFFLQEALVQGYQIKALARTPQKLDAYRGQIEIIAGDARDRAALESLLEGSDVIVSALGPVRADGDAALGLNTAASRHIVQLMPKYNIERYIAVSGAAVKVPGDKRNSTKKWLERMISLSLADTLRDKQAEYELLSTSSVGWTLIRCPIIRAQAFEQAPLASIESPSSFTLRAGELARFILEEIENKKYVDQAPFLNSQ